MTPSPREALQSRMSRLRRVSWRSLPSLLFIAILVAPGVSGGGATFGVYRSHDGGRSWSPTGRGLPPDLRVDALGQSGNTRLAGTERGIYVSPDDGETWTRPKQSLLERFKVSDFAEHGGQVFCATTGGVWASPDHGQSWFPAGDALAGIKVLSLASLGGHLFAGSDQQGAFRWSNPGTGWEPISAGLPDHAQMFQLAAQNRNLFAALYARGVFRYNATEKKWIPCGAEPALHLIAVEEALFSGRNPGGVFVSRDGGWRWTDAGLGLPENAPIWKIARHGQVLLVGTSGHSGLFRSDDGGASWTPSDDGLPRGGAPIALGANEKSVLAVILTGGQDRP